MSRKQANARKKAQIQTETQLDTLQEDQVDREEGIQEKLNDIEFDIKFRGYDCAQVDHYLNALTEDYNAICRESEALKQENRGMRKALAALGETKSGEIL